MELIETKAIAEVPKAWPYFLCNYISNTHPILT